MSDALSYSYLPKSTLPNDISDGLKELYVANTYLEQKKAAEIDDTKKALSVSNLAWNQDQQGISDRTNGFVAKTADAMKQYGTYSFAKLPIDVQQKLNAEKNDIEYDAKASLAWKKDTVDKTVQHASENPDKFETGETMKLLAAESLKPIRERQQKVFLVPKNNPKTVMQHLYEQTKDFKPIVTQGKAYLTKIGGQDAWQHEEKTQQLDEKGYAGLKQSMLSNEKINNDISIERAANPSFKNTTNSDYLDLIYKPILLKVNSKFTDVAAPKDDSWKFNGMGYSNGKYGVSAQVAPTAVANVNPTQTNSKAQSVIEDGIIVNLQMPENTKITTSAKNNLRVWDGSRWVTTNSGGKLDLKSPQLVYQPAFDGNPSGFYLRGDVMMPVGDKNEYMPSATYVGNDFTAIANQMGDIPIKNLNDEANRAIDMYNAKYPDKAVNYRVGVVKTNSTQQKGKIQPKSKSGLKWK